MEVDTREEEGWQEEVLYGSKYKLFKDEKTWEDAEAHCHGEGGHLASVLNDKENEELLALVGSQKPWIGGRDELEEGVWRWANGLSWGYTHWEEGSGNKGTGMNCAVMNNDRWRDSYCTNTQKFICQLDSKPQALRGNLTLKYTKHNLTISSFKVMYHHKATSQDRLDTLEEKRTTGFQLTWFLQNKKGNRPETNKPNQATIWKPEAASPRFQDQYLVKMIKLASRARANNMTREDILEKTVNNKAKLITNEFIQYTSMCSRGQVMIGFYPKVFDEMKITVNGKEDSTAVTDDDIETGYMLFSAIVYCSEPVALSQFLHNLLSTQSPRTIIQATVNTIQSGNLKEVFNRDRINQFYIALDKIFHFQFGKILLATASSSDLEAMLAKDWPFFTNFSQEIEECLNRTSCQGVAGLIQLLGKK